MIKTKIGTLPTNKRKGKPCHNCGRRVEWWRVNECYLTTGEKDTCNDCWDFFGAENSHSDGGHDVIAEWLGKGGDYDDEVASWRYINQEIEMMAGCRVCKGDGPGNVDPPVIEEPQKREGPKTWASHKGHLHPMTNSGRAACRRAAERAAGQGG